MRNQVKFPSPVTHPSETNTVAVDLRPLGQCRLNKYNVGDWVGLIADYEKDVISTSYIHANKQPLPRNQRGSADTQDSKAAGAFTMQQAHNLPPFKWHVRSQGS